MLCGRPCTFCCPPDHKSRPPCTPPCPGCLAIRPLFAPSHRLCFSLRKPAWFIGKGLASWQRTPGINPTYSPDLLPSLPFQETIADMRSRLYSSQSPFPLSTHLILITVLKGRHDYYHFTDKETESERKSKVSLKIKELFSDSVICLVS